LCKLPAFALSTLLQVGGAVLGTCRLERCAHADSTWWKLYLRGIESTASLQQLLAAALPAGTQPSQLRSLRINQSYLLLPAVLSCPLGHLTSLGLSSCKFPDAGALAVVEALLQQAPRLQSLALMGFPDAPSALPAVINRTGLRQLCLRGSSFKELPPGPYLSSELDQGPACGGPCARQPAVLSRGRLPDAAAAFCALQCMSPARPVTLSHQCTPLINLP